MNWSRVSMEAGEASLTFSWVPGSLTDLAPKPNPLLFVILFAVILGILALSLDWLLVPNQSIHGFTIFFTTAALWGAWIWLIFSMTALLHSLSTCRAELNKDARFRSPPFAFSFGLFNDFFRFSYIHIHSSKLGSVQFSAAGVHISKRNSRRHSNPIPTRDPDQRRAIADWAKRHNIPVTGDI